MKVTNPKGIHALTLLATTDGPDEFAAIDRIAAIFALDFNADCGWIRRYITKMEFLTIFIVADEPAR